MTQPVAPETTLVVILGASEWPEADLEGSSAFADSALDLMEFFLDPKGFGLPAHNLLNLFDKRHAPSELLVALGDFLESRLEQADYFDLVLYYVGHGFLAGNNDDFYLALKGTKSKYKNDTSLRVKNLANRVGESARHLRSYVIFDCCFAAAALPVFQSELSDVAMRKAAQAFPTKGTLLYCSSSKDNASRAPKDFRYTMFSGCLLQALREGRAAFAEKLTMVDVDTLVKHHLNRVFKKGAWVRPELHSPKQEYGDLRNLPLFPNPARRPLVSGVPRSVELARLTVSSSCAASFFLNGTHRAELQPYQPHSLDALQPGVYRILLKAEGFQTEDEMVELKRGEHLLRKFAPKPLAKPIAAQQPASEPPQRQAQLPQKKPRLKLWQGIVMGVALLLLGYRLWPKQPELSSPIENTDFIEKEDTPLGKSLKTEEPKKQEAISVQYQIFNEAGLQVPMVWCPPGTFSMGSPGSQKEAEKDEVQHRVTFTEGFWIGQTEVTQKQWQDLMGTNPSWQEGGANHPVENVSWEDAKRFIQRLNEKLGKTLYRLPTEAEWEYACRAGTETEFHTGRSLSAEQANYDGRFPYSGITQGVYRGKTTPVRSFAANPWSLHDMHGNVWEWCEDGLRPFDENPQTDPIGPELGIYRVIRGGSWNSNEESCRSADRRNFGIKERNGYVGFRLVRNGNESSKSKVIVARRVITPAKEVAENKSKPTEEKREVESQTLPLPNTSKPKSEKSSPDNQTKEAVIAEKPDDKIVDPLPKAGDLQTFREGGFEITMAWCPPGSFLMGSPESEKQRDKDETQHRVTVTQGFWLGQTEVTQAQWKAVMDSNPSNFVGDTLPVDSVSWDDAIEFIKRLNAKVGKEVYRLPTEAEWEYACRAGTNTPFHTGKNLTTDQANYNGNYPYAGFPKGEYREKTLPVGSFPGNAWGLQDMHGNLWEWCQDWKGDYAAGEQVDPGWPDSGARRVLRGGSWVGGGGGCRSAYRGGSTPGYRNHHIGFRLARGH